MASRAAAEPYIVLPPHYCACPAFHYEVLCRGEAPLCKHLLAARLAAALGRAPDIAVPDATLAAILVQAP